MYVQWFDYEYIIFKAGVNMFECTETEEFIYNGVVEPSYKKSTREDSNRSGHNRKMRGESALSNTYS